MLLRITFSWKIELTGNSSVCAADAFLHFRCRHPVFGGVSPKLKVRLLFWKLTIICTNKWQQEKIGKRKGRRQCRVSQCWPCLYNSQTGMNEMWKRGHTRTAETEGCQFYSRFLLLFNCYSTHFQLKKRAQIEFFYFSFTTLASLPVGSSFVGRR